MPRNYGLVGTSTDTARQGNRVVGRGRNTEALADRVNSGESVVVYGPLGHGKSFFVDAVASLLASRGVFTLRIRGSHALSGVPFGAMRTHTGLPLELPVDGAVADASQLLEYAVSCCGIERPIIQIDDAHLLDVMSLGWLSELAAAQSVTLLMSAASLSPEQPVTTQPAEMLNSLWIQGNVHRVDLQALTSLESEELIAELAPGVAIDRASIARIVSRGGGSPLYIRELTSEALRDRVIIEERDTLSPTVAPPTARILALLSPQLTALKPAELDGLALLGRLDGLSYVHALSIFRAAELRSLIQRGYIVRGADDVVSTHGMLADAAIALSDPDNGQRLTAQLVAALLDDRKRGRKLTPVECVLAAEQWCGPSGMPGVSEGLGSDVVTQILLQAAATCADRCISASSLKFSWQAHQLDPSLAASIAYSRALARARRFDEAARVLAAAEGNLQDASEAVILMRWWSSLCNIAPHMSASLDSLIARAETWFPGDRVIEGTIALARLAQLARGIDREIVATAARAIVETPDFDRIERIRAAACGASELATAGHLAAAAQLMSTAEALVATTTGVGNPSPEDDMVMEILAATVVIRCLSGGDVDAVSRRCDRLVDEAVHNHAYSRLALLGFIAAQIAQYRGDAAASEAELRMADAHLERSDPGGFRPFMRCLHAQSLARLGRPDEAYAVLGSAMDDAPPPAEFPWFHFIAEQTLRDLDQLFGRGAHEATSVTAIARADAARAWRLVGMFRTETDAPARKAAPASNEGALVLAAAAGVRALADRNASVLDGVAERLAALGAFGHARNASEDAAVIYAEMGDRASATLSRIRADQYADASHKSEPSELPTRAERLTSREAEIAGLAAQGLSNRDIARTLYLSIRTVESHLYQARQKLGAPSRRELSSILGVVAAS